MATTLTFGPHLVLAQSAGATSYLDGNDAGNTIVNDGTIEAFGTYTQVDPSNFVNKGIVDIGGSDIFRVFGSFDNLGSIAIASGGALSLAGDTTLADLGTIANAGLLDIYGGGTLDLGGGTIDIASGSKFGNVQLDGTIANGTIVGAGGTFTAGGTLAGVAVAGDLAFANQYYGLTVLGGLTGGGTLDLTAYDGSLYAAQSETFDDETILLGNADRIYAYGATTNAAGQAVGNTLTFGPHLVLAQSAGATSYLDGNDAGNTIVNDGTIEAFGTYTQVDATSLVNAGTIAIGGSDIFRVFSSFDNTGVIAIASGGALSLAGDATLADLGTIANAGLLDIYGGGTLDLGGGTIDIASGSEFGNVQLDGTIANGTIVGAGGTFTAGGTLAGVAVAGDLAFANQYYGLTVLGGLTGGGTLDLTAYDGSLYAAQSETFDDETILLGNADRIYAYGATTNAAGQSGRPRR